MLKNKYLLLVVAVVALVEPLAHAKTSGRETGNGGNDVALEFSELTLEAIQEVESDQELINILKGVHLKKVLKGAVVLMVEDSLTVKKGDITQEVTAINYSSPDTILINEARWKHMRNKISKKTLGLHEVLGLAGLESTGDYRISAVYQQKFRIPPKCESGQFPPPFDSGR